MKALLLLLVGCCSLFATDFTTLDGEHYTGTIKRVEPDGIVLITTDGLPKIKFKNLPPEICKQYGYDPEKELKYRQQVAEEKQREADRQKTEKLKSEEAALKRESALAALETKQQLKKQEEEKAAQAKYLQENPPPDPWIKVPFVPVKIEKVIGTNVLAEEMTAYEVGGSYVSSGMYSKRYGSQWVYEATGRRVYLEGVSNVAQGDQISVQIQEDGFLEEGGEKLRKWKVHKIHQ